jgi:tyrosine-protein kinase Etk/Wzc
MRDYQLYEAMYTYLLQKRSSHELKKAEALSRFRTIEPIYTNPAPAKPKKLLILIVGFITALILSIFIVFFLEFLRSEEPNE